MSLLVPLLAVQILTLALFVFAFLSFRSKVAYYEAVIAESFESVRSKVAYYEAVIAESFEALKKAKEHYENVVNSFFASQPEGKPSPFGNLIASIAAVFANSIVQSAEATLRGSQGGANKAEAMAARAQALSANPLLGMMGGMKLGKNPLINSLVSGLAQKFFGGNGNHGTPSSGSDEVKFNL